MRERAEPADPQLELPNVTFIPRFGILHLILWTCCSAIYLALAGLIQAFQGGLANGYIEIQQTIGVIQSVVTGGVFTGALVLLTARARSGPPLLREPGHWLLFVAAMLTIVELPFLLVSLMTQLREENWFWVVFGAMALLTSFVFALAVKHSCSRSWKVLFVGLLLMAAVQSLFFIGIGLGDVGFGSSIVLLYAVSTWGGLVLAGAMVVVTVVELRVRRQRDWVHWMGVSTHVATSSTSLVWAVAGWFQGDLS